MEAAELRRDTRLRFGDVEEHAWGWLIDHPAEAQSVFDRYHGTSPVCLCTPEGVSIHITRGPSHFFLARNPNTGHRHAWFCRFYSDAGNEWAVPRHGARPAQDQDRSTQPPPVLPGGAPEAERNQAPVDDSLLDCSSIPLGSTQPPALDDAGSALHDLLVRLWQIAGFHRYSPAMAGKRGYWLVHRHLPLSAGELMVAPGKPLAPRIFVPEPYRGRDHRVEHQEAVSRSLWEVERAAGGAFLVAGEIREVVPTEYGVAIHLKHLPYRELTLFASSAVKDRDLGGVLGDSIPGRQWILASIARSSHGNMRVLAAGILHTTLELVPVFSLDEARLAERLVAEGRRFARPLPPRAGDSSPCFLLLDTGATRGHPLWATDIEQPALPSIAVREGRSHD